nr:zeaxanthin epoxidase, chloroplastic [Ipomoea batatas]
MLSKSWLIIKCLPRLPPHFCFLFSIPLTKNSKKSQPRNMELTTTTQSLSHAKIPKLFSNGGTFFAQNSVNFLGYNCLPRNLQCSAKHLRSLGAIHASEGQNTSTAVSIKWLLEPVGDGDTKHIGYPTAMPGAFEISSGAITVGRVSEKADMVIPVPTGNYRVPT